VGRRGSQAGQLELDLHCLVDPESETRAVQPPVERVEQGRRRHGRRTEDESEAGQCVDRGALTAGDVERGPRRHVALLCRQVWGELPNAQRCDTDCDGSCSCPVHALDAGSGVEQTLLMASAFTT
jgi:hypothetical protein